MRISDWSSDVCSSDLRHAVYKGLSCTIWSDHDSCVLLQKLRRITMNIASQEHCFHKLNPLWMTILVLWTGSTKMETSATTDCLYVWCDSDFMWCVCGASRRRRPGGRRNSRAERAYGAALRFTSRARKTVV